MKTIMFALFVVMRNYQKNHIIRTGIHLTKYVRVVDLNLDLTIRAEKLHMKNIVTSGLKKE